MLPGTLVTVIGLMPVGFAQSSPGEYVRNLFWVVCTALLASWGRGCNVYAILE
jgi:multidrug efflux pump subunit AcrB